MTTPTGCAWDCGKAAKFELYADGADIGKKAGLLAVSCGQHLPQLAEAALEGAGLVILRRIPKPSTRRPKPINARR